ncbi:unnamed protein product [Pedinophyceae sp. YPF-701]|nr:unnamed protein product [Pedinophyceae sp. YPF-701]
MGLWPKRSSLPSQPSTADEPSLPNNVDSLRHMVIALKKENESLRKAALAANGSGPSPSRSGYMHMYEEMTSGFFIGRWHPRYFVLAGQSLVYYSQDKDLGMAPLGAVDVAGCVVEYEGRKKGKYWAFEITDQYGESLLRLSTENHADSDRWVNALENAGCSVIGLTVSVRNSDASGRNTVGGADSGDNDTATSGLRGGKRGSYGPGSRRTSTGGGGLRRRTVGDQRAREGDADGRLLERRDEGRASDGAKSEKAAREGREEDRRAGLRPRMRGSTPLHRQPRFSILSSEQLSHHRHSGMINLGMVILFATNSRLILENLLKYGVLFRPMDWLAELGIAPGGSAISPLVSLCWALLATTLFLGLQIEKLGNSLYVGEKAGRRRARVTEAVLFVLNLLNTSAALVVPCTAIVATRAPPVPSFALCTCAVVVWMKLVSYAHFHVDIRSRRRKRQKVPGERGSDDDLYAVDSHLQWPENLTLGNMAYFAAAPTLIYQMAYPRSPRVRHRWLLRRVAELVLYITVMMFIIEQYIQPTMRNSMRPLDDMDWVRVAERVLKLSIPVLYLWLCMFYVLFHLWLNILAEVLRFGDREFYRDWWNASTIEEYWRMWNMPVHKWLLRHVYFPLVAMRIPRSASMLACFFVSAVFHELAVGVPLHVVRAWAFFGIMFQVPMVMITNWMKKSLRHETLGNIFFWISFCILGQPISILLYYHDYFLSQLNGAGTL